MLETIKNIHPSLLSLGAGIFAWALSALGAAAVLIREDMSQKFFDMMLGFAGGVMIAASFWSLLAPSIEISSGLAAPWFPAAAGFFLGAAVMRGMDKFLPHLHLGFMTTESEGIKTSWKRSVLLVLAITLHNIPEGLALGVAIAAAASGFPGASLAAAAALTIGIGLHNIPEGFAVSVSLRREGLSRFKSFQYGQLSAALYPVTALFGAAAVILTQGLLPYALGFAAGAMIFVVVEEVIPESQRHGNTDIATAGAIIGFLMMMIMDVAMH